MSTEPPPINSPAPKKRRLGCLAWFGIGLVACALSLAGLLAYGRHQRTRGQIEQAATALLAGDAATALYALHSAHEEHPDDAPISSLYESVQQKWLESIDRQIADKTSAQRYMFLSEDPAYRDSRLLSEPLATTFRQFVDRNTEDTRVYIDETVARAMDLVEAGKTTDGWNEIETLRACWRYPGINDLRASFDAFYTARLLILAGDLGQAGQIDSARKLLDQLEKNGNPAAQAAVLFRIDLGDYLLHVNQAVLAASKGDQPTAQTKLKEARVLFSRLVASPELQKFFSDRPKKDRGTALIEQLNAAEGAVQILAVKAPAR